MNANATDSILPAASTLLGWILFSVVSIIAIGYAKFKQEWHAGIIGVVIGIYPYFIPSGPIFWTLGILLTGLLFVPRRHLPW
ncbi:MAG: hypothetical protein MUF31_03665 [Akkermansiaceae bacterium]|jgi:hypothetical protein|nr:hypothetical protein [Akkermansiaceae bacterium]